MDSNVAEPYSGAFRKDSMWPSVPAHEALRHCRRFLVDLLTNQLPAGAAGPDAPDAPDVDVLGVVCHLTAASRLAESNLVGPPPPPVMARSEPNLVEVLVEWERSGVAVEDALRRTRGLTGSLLAMNLFTYELDIRRAMGVGDPAYHPALAMALDVAVSGAGAMVGLLGLPPVRFETPGSCWEVGEGEPEVTVWAAPLELYRCLIGRRPPGRIRSLRWSDDPEPWLQVFEWQPFRPSDIPVGRPRCGHVVYRV